MNYKVDRSVIIKKSLLTPNPWNPNKTKPRQQQAIAESIKTYSQVLDIIVRPDPENEGKFQIIDGEHRYQELGEDVYVTILHGLPEEEAKKLTVILNETRGDADKIELAQLLSSISDYFGDDLINALPFDEKELGEIVALADINWDSFDSGDETEDESDFNNGEKAEEYTEIRLSFSTEESILVTEAIEQISEKNKIKDRKEENSIIFLVNKYLNSIG